MKLFGSKSKAVIGIDVGTHSIKLVELAGSYAAPRVIAWGVEPLPAGAFSENTITDAEAVAQALNSLIVKSGANANTVAVSISSSHAITKVLAVSGLLPATGRPIKTRFPYACAPEGLKLATDNNSQTH